MINYMGRNSIPLKIVKITDNSSCYGVFSANVADTKIIMISY